MRERFFEIINNIDDTKKRLIIYNEKESVGYLFDRQELYELYSILREEFKDT